MLGVPTKRLHIRALTVGVAAIAAVFAVAAASSDPAAEPSEPSAMPTTSSGAPSTSSAAPATTSIPAAADASAPTTGGAAPIAEDLAGSSSCRDCHADFYKLWAPSHHGKAMQPYTAEFAAAHLTPQATEIQVGNHVYRAFVGPDEGWVTERTVNVGSNGANGEDESSPRKLPIVHVLGGKNIYYFLTPLSRGRLQTLPVAYDVVQKVWYDTSASAMRHFPSGFEDEPLDWTDRAYTFNTSCHGCHVSQLTTNFDPVQNAYDTQWAEPGINCETCHGPAGEHVRVYREAEKTGEKLSDPRIISMSKLTPDQRDAACAACHAKLTPLSNSFTPGERFFDHFDLRTIEDPDFYADGRDLGENYTITTWLLNPCVTKGELECLHCHTSSGRYRFANLPNAEANGACLPCHAERVRNIAAHTHHDVNGPAGQCIACHMPQTTFARMRRTDHSHRPPMPAATAAFESPNSCNLCHQDKDAAWANQHVTQWHGSDYQTETLAVGKLIQAARDEDWTALSAMGGYIASPDHNAVFANALVRLIENCPGDDKWPVLLAAMNDVSPLVRSSAASALAYCPTPQALPALVAATRDDYRLVRIRAAASLAGREQQVQNPDDLAALRKAQAEFEASMRTRLDDPASYLNLGNFHLNSGDTRQAIADFLAAEHVDPTNVPARVNAALAYNVLGENDAAEAKLREAARLAPESAVTQFNLGLLLGELSKTADAVAAFRAALKADPDFAPAAFNLAVLLSETDLDESIALCERAAESEPQSPRYAYTLAYYQNAKGEPEKAIATLEALIARHPDFPDAYAFLGMLHTERGNTGKAHDVYQRAANESSLPNDAHQYFVQQAEQTKSGE